MNVVIRPAGSHERDLAALVATVNATRPDEPTSIDDMQWADATYPGGVRFLAEVAGRPVGAATIGRIYVHPPEFDGLWTTVDVLTDARREGVGTALLAAVSDIARAAGKSAMLVPVSEGRPEGIEFFVHRGFTEYERSKSVELVLAGRVAPPGDPPTGVILTSLAERPDLIAGVHAVANETYPDIPGGEEPMAVGDLAEFRARNVDRHGIPKDAFMVALECDSGRVIGYASLILAPGGNQLVAWHDMTGIVRDWRGRGVATALKRATIGWAIANGVALLRTGNDTTNAPMRAVNARLGYRPFPDTLILRGPLVGAMMDRA